MIETPTNMKYRKNKKQAAGCRSAVCLLEIDTASQLLTRRLQGCREQLDSQAVGQGQGGQAGHQGRRDHAGCASWLLWPCEAEGGGVQAGAEAEAQAQAQAGEQAEPLCGRGEARQLWQGFSLARSSLIFSFYCTCCRPKRRRERLGCRGSGPPQCCQHGSCLWRRSCC